MAKKKVTLRDLSLRGETTHTRWGHVTFDREGMAELEVEEEDLQMLRDIRWLHEPAAAPPPAPEPPKYKDPAPPTATPAKEPQRDGETFHASASEPDPTGKKPQKVTHHVTNQPDHDPDAPPGAGPFDASDVTPPQGTAAKKRRG